MCCRTVLTKKSEFFCVLEVQDNLELLTKKKLPKHFFGVSKTIKPFYIFKYVTYFPIRAYVCVCAVGKNG
jgi:hypothetical protein